MNSADGVYKAMLFNFHTRDLQTLLETFDQSKLGRKLELRSRALNLLNNVPANVDITAYKAKIKKIYRYNIIGNDHNVVTLGMLKQQQQQPQQQHYQQQQQQQQQQLQLQHYQQQQQQQLQHYQQQQHQQHYQQQQRHYQQQQQQHKQQEQQQQTQQQEQHKQQLQRRRQQQQQQQQQLQFSHPVVFHHPQYFQQPMHLANTRFLHVPQIQKNINGSNVQFNQLIGNRFILLNNQQFHVVNTNVTNTPSTQNCSVVRYTSSQTNTLFKKLPFYEICSAIIKPKTLVSSGICTLPNTSTNQNTNEAIYNFKLTVDQVNLISMNCDLSNGKNEYVYQVQIRICSSQTEAYELTDLMPIGVNIRIGDKHCKLPPIPNVRPGAVARRPAKPINCTPLLKLKPYIMNTITINWIPDDKTYTVGVFLVKQLSSEMLVQNIINKGLKSSKETKNYVINKMANLDPDLATTSYRVPLVCPLGKVRMKYPAKSIKCDHLQCFDVTTFILMNEKRPKWICPTCNKPCLYDDIQIQSYFLEVLNSSNLPESCKEIELLSDGTWKVFNENNNNLNVENNTKNIKNIEFVNLVDSDEDDYNYNVVKTKICSTDSEISKVNYIDLTLSDEEETSKKQEDENAASSLIEEIMVYDVVNL